LSALLGGSGTSAGRGIVAAGDLKSRAYQAYVAAGLPPDEWPAFDQLIAHESNWQPTAQNPGSTAHGLGQFLDSTWASVGGTKTDDPMQQLQYVFQYLKQRPDYHGSPEAAWSLWQSRSPHWYQTGGPTPPGRAVAYPAILHGDEYVISARGRATVPDSFLHALNQGMVDPKELPHLAVGGDLRDVLRGLPAPSPKPPPRPPDANLKIPDALPKIPRPQPTPPPPPPPIPPPPPPTEPTPPPPAPPSQTPTFAPGPGGSVAPPGPTDHSLPWVNQAIASGAAAIGNAVQTAAAIGTFGAAGMGGGGLGGALGGGGGGLSISGLFQQGGKIAQGVANVVSSAMVGSVPGSFMTTPEVYGRTLRSEQNAPRTATDRYGLGSTYNISGHDTRDVMREVDLRQGMEAQAVMAARRPR
jgi:hypothetical protein